MGLEPDRPSDQAGDAAQLFGLVPGEPGHLVTEQPRAWGNSLRVTLVGLGDSRAKEQMATSPYRVPASLGQTAGDTLENQGQEGHRDFQCTLCKASAQTKFLL